MRIAQGLTGVCALSQFEDGLYREVFLQPPLRAPALALLELEQKACKW
jgi:hypothetical protein